MLRCSHNKSPIVSSLFDSTKQYEWQYYCCHCNCTCSVELFHSCKTCGSCFSDILHASCASLYNWSGNHLQHLNRYRISRILTSCFWLSQYWGVGSMIGNLVMTISFIYRDGGIDVDRSLIFADIYLGLYSFILGMYGLYGDQNMSTKTKQSRRDLNGELPKTVMDCQSSNTYLSKCFKPFCHFFPAATLPPINMRDFTTLRLIGEKTNNIYIYIYNHKHWWMIHPLS